MSVSVSVKNVANESAILEVTETIHAEIVTVPKFLEAYPSLARFPTRFEHTNLSALEAPAICYIARGSKAFERQVLQSWFVNFSESTINGVRMDEHRRQALLMDALRAMAVQKPVSFRADPSDEDFHLVSTGKGIHLFFCSTPGNGELAKMTIIKVLSA